MKRFVTRFGADGSSATVIESALIMVLVGLACITAWMHASTSLNILSASANTTVSVETTGSVRSRWLHRALRTRRLRCVNQVEMSLIAQSRDVSQAG